MRKYNMGLRKQIESIRSANPSMSLSHIARVVGVSKQRVHQILRSNHDINTMRDHIEKEIVKSVSKATKGVKRRVERKVA